MSNLEVSGGMVKKTMKYNIGFVVYRIVPLVACCHIHFIIQYSANKSNTTVVWYLHGEYIKFFHWKCILIGSFDGGLRNPVLYVVDDGIQVGYEYTHLITSSCKLDMLENISQIKHLQAAKNWRSPLLDVSRLSPLLDVSRLKPGHYDQLLLY